MKGLGAIVVILALVMGLVPIFSDCQSQGNVIELTNGKTIPMTCHWTGRAALAMAVPLLAAGVLLMASRRKETWRALAAVIAVTGVMVILLPTVLIKVCANEQMTCNLIEEPTLIMAGVLAVAAGAAGLLRARGGE
jgi:Domain of unknown function (DUF4418)